MASVAKRTPAVVTVTLLVLLFVMQETVSVSLCMALSPTSTAAAQKIGALSISRSSRTY